MFDESAVVIPVAMIELNETDATLGEAARDEAVAREGTGLVHVGAVAVDRGGGFAFEVHELGHAALHAVGHFKLADACLDLGVAAAGEVLAIEIGDAVEHQAATFAGEPGGIIEIEYGLAGPAELHALMLARQKAAAPKTRKQALAGAGFVDREQHDERREVFVDLAQAVVGPRAHARAAGELTAALEKRDRGIVVDRLGVHRADDANLVGDAASVRE